jgi:peptidoglycan/LPS O-acetylase OafA/YrhL
MTVMPVAIPLLAPMWSLSVEEHFYFIWPSLVRGLSRRRLASVSVAILLLSPVARFLGTLFLRSELMKNYRYPDVAMYVLPPFRLDGLAAGALLALLLECPTQELVGRLRRRSGWLALLLTMLFFVLPHFFPRFSREANSWAFNSFGYSLTSIMAFFLIAYLLLQPGSAVSRLFASRVLVFVGRISYGVYLYQNITHAMVGHRLHVLLHRAPSQWMMLPFDAGATLALATVSFYVVERPATTWGRAFSAYFQEREALATE